MEKWLGVILLVALWSVVAATIVASSRAPESYGLLGMTANATMSELLNAVITLLGAHLAAVALRNLRSFGGSSFRILVGSVGVLMVFSGLPLSVYYYDDVADARAGIVALRDRVEHDLDRSVHLLDHPRLQGVMRERAGRTRAAQTFWRDGTITEYESASGETVIYEPSAAETDARRRLLDLERTSARFWALQVGRPAVAAISVLIVLTMGLRRRHDAAAFC